MSQPRNARSLTARSVIASTLLGTEPPSLPARVLVRAGALFGISEGSTRVALSRMVANDELRAEDGVYTLSGDRLLARQARQRASRRPDVRAWDGTWVLAIVVGERREAAARAELRDRLRDVRVAELREGVWTRPDNLAFEWPDVVRAQCTIATGAHLDGATSRGLWDVAGWQQGANALRREMRSLVGRLERHDTAALAPGFITSAAVLRQLQADPLLPEALLPARWPGTALRDEYDRFDRAYRAVLREWFRSQG